MKLKFNRKLIADFDKSAREFWHKKITRRILLFMGLFILALAAAFFSVNLIYKDKILPHTYIGSINFGGMTRAEAKDALIGLINQNKNEELNFLWKDKTYSLKLSDFDVSYDNKLDTTLDRLFSIGRQGTFGTVTKETLRSIFLKNNTKAAFEYKDNILNDYLTGIAKNIDIPEKDATIEINNLEPKVIPEEIGQRFETIQNHKLSLDFIGSFSFPQIMPYKVSTIYPKINAAAAEEAIPKVKNILGHKLALKGENKSYELSAEDIAGMIEFVARIDPKTALGSSRDAIQIYKLAPEVSSAKLGEKVAAISPDIYQEPKDPKFEVSGGRVSAFQVAQTGYELDQEKAIGVITQAIMAGQESVDLPIKVTEPALSSDNPEELGLKELIGQGDTSWRGSPQNRIHNLSLGAERISGTIVKPGEEFSTLKAIGPVDGEHGFLQELVIKNSTQVTPEFGGGLCQVSTTLFRAVLNSGLNITARTPHSFRVSYYEPPVGMDATIYDPAPDFKFINNYSTPIFIWGIASNNGLSFQIYGTKDGRKIEISDPVIYDYTSAPGAVYSESGSMAAGQIRQVERATSGASASFNYKVTASDGNVLQQETYVSKYVPIPDTYLYGPGTEGIPGRESPPQVEATSTPAPQPTTGGTSKPKN